MHMEIYRVIQKDKVSRAVGGMKLCSKPRGLFKSRSCEQSRVDLILPIFQFCFSGDCSSGRERPDTCMHCKPDCRARASLNAIDKLAKDSSASCVATKLPWNSTGSVQYVDSHVLECFEDERVLECTAMNAGIAAWAALACTSRGAVCASRAHTAPLPGHEHVCQN